MGRACGLDLGENIRVNYRMMVRKHSTCSLGGQRSSWQNIVKMILMELCLKNVKLSLCLMN
jgi:hypothetical protein